MAIPPLTVDKAHNSRRKALVNDETCVQTNRLFSSLSFKAPQFLPLTKKPTHVLFKSAK
jgi:hypothetical protein